MERIAADLGPSTALAPPWLAAFITAGLAALERRLAAELAMDAVDAAHAGKP